MERSECIVDEHDHVLLGFGVCDRQEALINAVYVDPRCVNRHVGTGLVTHLEGLIAGRGSSQVRLNSTLNAAGFYERLGYVRRCDSVNRLTNGVAIPCVEMVKELLSRV
ncbi:MAG: GNAT family N-acetyltransferase [Myxococcales bacterium]